MEHAEDRVLSTQDDELSVVEGRLPLLLLLLAPLLVIYVNDVSGVVDSEDVGLRELWDPT